MRFQYLFSLSFLAVAVTQTLSLPIRSESDDLAIRNLEDDADLFLRDSMEIEERELTDLFDSFDRRDNTYKIKPKAVKKTAAEAKQRKEHVRNTAATNKAANAAKKAHLQKQDVPKYGKPRSAKKQKPNHPGYRAESRAKGFRLPKQPKTPKPDMVKGQAKSTKAKETQAKALARKHARLAEGRKKFGPAAAAHKDTVGLPGRKEKFPVKGEHTYTGKDVRVANFNSHHFKNNKVGESPKAFRNDLQGPAGAKTRPLANMKGPGHEFPLTAGNRAGYQGGEKGAARLITQDHTRADGKQVTKFGGVIAHDVSKKPVAGAAKVAGADDHFQVHPQ